MKKIILKPIKYYGLLILADFYSLKRQFELSYVFYKKAISRYNDKQLKGNSLYLYAKTLHSCGYSEEALEILNKLIENSDASHKRFYTLRSNVYMSLRKYSLAEFDARSAIDIKANVAVDYYLLGIILIMQKRWYQAQEALVMAQKNGYKTAKFYRRLGQAYFYMEDYKNAYKNYKLASNSWKEKFSNSVSAAEIYYLAGWSLNISEPDNEEVKSLYDSAIKYDKELKCDLYGISAFHIKYKNYSAAIEYLDKKETLNIYKKSDIEYAKSIAQQGIGDTQSALISIESSLSEDYTAADSHYIKSKLLTEQGNSKEAAASYKKYLDRLNYFDEILYGEYLGLLIEAGDYDEAQKQVELVNLIKKANFGVGKKDEDMQVSAIKSYVSMSTSLAIDEKCVLYESFAGASIGDNPGSILKVLLKDPKYEDYTHIVVLENSSDLPSSLRKYKNIILVERSSFRYAYYLAISKYLINNSTFPYWFICRDGQKYLNTWHGVPWKTLGKDIKSSFLEMGNSQRNLLQATHLVNPNSYTTDIMTDRYDIKHIYNGKLAEIGYPRIDETINMSQARKNAIKDSLGINTGKKIVFYAPTWRGVMGNENKNFHNTRKDIEELKKIDCEIIFRGHYFVDSEIDDKIITSVSVEKKYSTNELLAVADILVTDYSSLAFDFMATKKQIVYYLYDYEEYKSNRGLYFEHDELPGKKAFSRDELIDILNQETKKTNFKTDSKYTGAISKFGAKDDGKSTGRVIDFFFNDNSEYEVDIKNDDKKNTLIYIGSLPSNGITASGTNLINNIDTNRVNIHLIIDGQSIASDQTRLNNFYKLRKDIKIIARAGGLYADYSSRQLINKRNNNLEKLTASEESQYSQIYSREYKRILANSKIDYVVNFEGYSRQYVSILSGASKDIYKSIYIHSDIYSEYRNRFKYMKVIFDQYNKYDKIVSVSKSTSELNKDNLSKHFGLSVAKFDYIDNVQNPGEVIAKSKQKLEVESDKRLFSKDFTTFITVGRHSIEKDHDKLIRAFAKVHAKHSKTKLIVIGDGPQRYQLQELVKELKLHESVHMLGLRSTPYPYIKMSDCFELSSNYEGQSVVLFEALTLNKPIIATDIIANRGILAGGYGELCENSIDGMARAMNKFIDGDIRLKKFDIDKYNAGALDMFYKKVLGE